MWKHSLPLKIKVFAWLLLRRRLMTRSLLQRMVTNSLTECPLCAKVVEDCYHLFFTCPLAQTVWQATSIGRLVVTSEEAFSGSLSAAEHFVAKLSGTLFLTHFGPSGSIRMRSYLGVVPRPLMLSSTTRGGLRLFSTEMV